MKKLLLILMMTVTAIINSQNYQYLGEYTSNGTPLYLETPGDNISYETLEMISNSIPESYPVPDYNPHYISSGYDTNIELNDTADIWVTFVSEGAGYRNVLGFYTYDIDNPSPTPPTAEEITIIFPNASALGSGGGLQVGDKVKIGTFEAGTGIGWVLLANAWSANSSTVKDGFWKVYSNPEYNPETQEDLKHHNVLLNDPDNQRIILGFEDIRRDYGSCDNDFNDAVFYVTASPYSAMRTTNFVDVSSATDVTSAHDGGLESNGKLASLIAKRNFTRKKVGNLLNNRSVQKLYKKKSIKKLVGKTPEIETLLPETGMYKTEKAYVSTPIDLLDITNANEIFSVDYYTEDKRVSAILATVTQGEVYNHSKEICDRLNNSILKEVKTVLVRGHKLIISKIQRATGEIEYTLGFSVKLGENENNLYSLWNIEEYPKGDYYNFQLWGSSLSQVFSNSNYIIDALTSALPLNSKLEEDVIPPVFVSSGFYKDGNIHLNIINKVKAKSVVVDVNMTTTEVSDTTENLSKIINLSGDWNETIIVKTGTLFDAGLSLATKYSKQIDGLYLADGPWGIDYLEEEVDVTLFNIDNKESDYDEDSHQVERQPALKGKVKGTINLFRHVLAGDQTLNVSNYGAIQFNIQNTQPIELILVSEGLKDWNNRLRIKIPANLEKKIYSISLNDFVDANGKAGLITDVKTIVFSLQGDYKNHVPFILEVDEVAFRENIELVVEEEQEEEVLLNLKNKKLIAIPNPMTSSGEINFTSVKNEIVILNIYNQLGKLIYQTNYSVLIGENSIPIERRSLISGIYICTIISNSKKYNSLKLAIH
ncbi:DUF4114 domain-containing protein [Tenacibaculum salmonis]|uniref:DUF4114 domain-containing protein n=1 Tax=Tenacibaculum sp. P3-BQ1 TaxID=3232310 RepID=UPI0034DEA6F2